MTLELHAVEARLRAAAVAAEWPATPDLRGPVLGRVEAATPDLRGPVLARIAGARPAPTARRARVTIIRGLALALVAVIAAAGLAAALGYRLPGLEVVVVETLPPAGTSLDLGSPVPLPEALGVDRPHVVVPSVLAAPSTAWVVGAADRRIVTLAWRADAGEPTLEGSDLELVLMAVAGRADEALVVKELGRDARIEPVTVRGERGWWISGDLHALRFMRPDGQPGLLPARLAGDTLVFARDGTLYRLESALGRERTVTIAESMP